jgi:hypothetical protein
MKFIHDYSIGSFGGLRNCQGNSGSVDCLRFQSLGSPDISVQALALEFKKYIVAIIAENIAEIASPFNSNVFVPLNYIPSPYINRFWRYALLNTESFQNFCMAVFKYFTPKLDIQPFVVGPNNFHVYDDDEVFDKYNESIRIIEQYFRSTDRAIWPHYVDEMTLGVHFRSFIWVNDQTETQLIDYFRYEPANSYKNFRLVLEEFQRSVRNGTESLESSETLLRLVSVNSRKKVDDFIKPLERATLEYLFDETIFNTPLPNDMLVVLSEEQLISVMEARRWIVEYKKFILMLLVTKVPIVPSFQVEQVWRLHMNYSENYLRFMLKNRINKSFAFPPNLSNNQQNILDSQYDTTVDFYSALFGGSIPFDLWQFKQQRFSEKTTGWHWTSLVDLFAAAQGTTSTVLLSENSSQVAEHDSTLATNKKLISSSVAE